MKVTSEIEIMVIDLAGEGKSKPQIMVATGLSKATVSRILVRNNIKLSHTNIINSDEYRLKRQQLNNSEEYRQKHSEYQKSRWQDPELLNKHSGIMKEICGKEEYRKLQSEVHKGLMDDDNKQELSLKMKEKWKDPTYRDKMEIFLKSEDHRKHLSEVELKVWEDPELRKQSSINSKMLWQDKEFRRKFSVGRENMKDTMTTPHRKVCEMLSSLGIIFETEKSIDKWNFDIFVPSHNILIEVQGDYWHSREERIQRDKAKLTYINRHYPDLKLLYIWEYECKDENKALLKIKKWFS